MSVLKKVIKYSISLLKRPKLILYHNSIGRNVEICKGAYLTNSKIGHHTYVGMYSYLNHVKMGDYCSISGYVTIGAMEHDYHGVSTSTFLNKNGYNDRQTNIGNDVWIGAQTVIRQGVSIGDGAVIGANSFVNKDVPPYAIVFGTPAKIYKYRFCEDDIKHITQSHFWDFPPKEANLIVNKVALHEDSVS